MAKAKKEEPAYYYMGEPIYKGTPRHAELEKEFDDREKHGGLTGLLKHRLKEVEQALKELKDTAKEIKL